MPSSFPSQKSAFKPAWWLHNSHLQTIYPAIVRKTANPPESLRERIVTPDDDFIDIDFCGKIQSNKPLVILLHGLTGSSQSNYIKGIQHALLKQNWRSAAVNFRGCSGEPNRRARCYHSGETEDIQTVYQTLHLQDPNSPIAVVGFSLGGNVLLKWLGEQGPKVDLFAAVAVSVPLELSICATKLDSGFSRFYRNRLLAELNTYMTLKQQHLSLIGKEDEAKKIVALGDLSTIRSFWQYDDRVVAALHGFTDVHDYYNKSSSRQFLKTIALPTLVIQAIDDPFMTQDVIPRVEELSPSVQLEISECGGHVGFVSGLNPFTPTYWLEQRILEFLQIHCPLKTDPHAGI